ncbi:MAG: hypothetical protein Ct9H300mP22_0220 [Gammaproteobacteria bacterium]|nr:MAG: hypothetical protein Ct9H300mP22_0220 [Gammaproteobacteria bacterium]
MTFWGLAPIWEYIPCSPFFGLGLIIWGKSIAPFVMIWEPPFELRYLSSIFMIPVFILAVAGNIPMSFLRWQLRNPMLLGVIIWGVAHLWANGDLASHTSLWKFYSLGRPKIFNIARQCNTN